jgi:hypothetical protein
MRRTGVIRFTLPILVCLAAIACGAKSRPANDPSTTSPPAEQTTTPEPVVENTASGDDSDVGMQFQEREDKAEASDRTPPPTKSWKPVDKDKPAKNARQPAEEKGAK